MQVGTKPRSTSHIAYSIRYIEMTGPAWTHIVISDVDLLHHLDGCLLFCAQGNRVSRDTMGERRQRRRSSEYNLNEYTKEKKNDYKRQKAYQAV
jgi:hypothetical protein